MDSGHYCHLGVKNCLKIIVENKRALNNKINTVNLLVNIDGAPLVGNSSEKGLWIILCRDPEVESVHLISVYCGAKKPEDQNNFLKYFVEDSVDLINNGFTHNEILYYIRIYGFICDAPAKAFVLCTKYHSGYSSCSKCLIEGEYYSSVCFPVSNIKKLEMYCNDYLRTDIKFKNLEYMGEYQRGETILNQLPHVGLVSNVLLDSMHLVYLGAMKQLIRHWIGDKDRKKKLFKLSDQQIEQISCRLESLKNVLSFEFNRRSRSLIYWKQWKATEYRHFLLYFGSFILKDILKPEIYNNFLKLHITMIILSNKLLLSEPENIQFAESLIVQFINDFQKIYGNKIVTHNIHSLLHLPKDVQKYGSFERFSAFSFENYICSLKKLIRKDDKPLQQIARRLTEYESVRDIKYKYIKNKIKVEKLHYNRFLPNTRKYDSQFTILKTDSCRIDINDERNNCVMLKDGSIVNVLNIAKKR